MSKGTTFFNFILKRYVTRDKVCVLPNEIVIAKPGAKFSFPKKKKKLVSKLQIHDAKGVQYLPDDIGIKFPRMIEIEVVRCSVKFLRFRNFRKLYQLRRLILSDNKLEMLNANVFNDLRDLRVLKLNRNCIKFIPAEIFSRQLQISSVEVISNRLTSLDVTTFKINTNIKNINFANNKLKCLEPGTFDPLRRLQKLSLENNEISSLPGKLCNNCKNLIELNLRKNLITNIPHNFLSNLNSLVQFFASRNPLKIIDFAIFEKTNSPHMIAKFDNIGKTRLKNIDTLIKIKRVHSLTLFNNTCINNEYFRKPDRGDEEYRSYFNLKRDYKVNCTELLSKFNNVHNRVVNFTSISSTDKDLGTWNDEHENGYLSRY